MNLKRVNLEKWIEGEATSSIKYRSAEASDDDKDKTSVEAGNDNGSWLERPPCNDQDASQWGSYLFDGIDVDHGFLFDGLGDWSMG